MKNKKSPRKLNLLEPGLNMCKGILLLAVLGLVFQLLGLLVAASLLWGCALLLLLVLLILVGVEQRQDHRLYLAAKKENPEIK